MIRTGLLLAPIALAGCAASPHMREAQGQAVRADATAATVVFVRPSAYYGGSWTRVVDGDGRFLGDVRGESMAAVKMKPGAALLCSLAGYDAQATRATLEAGRVYYVEVGFVPGALGWRAPAFAVGPSRVQWPMLPVWLRDARLLVADEASGQAELRRDDERTRSLLVDCRRAWEGYSAAEREKRTLRPDDGVPSPVEPAR